MMRAECRIDARVLDLAEHRNILRGIFGDEDCDLRIFEVCAIDKLLTDEGGRILSLHASNVKLSNQGKNHLSGIADAQFAAEFRGVEH